MSWQGNRPCRTEHCRQWRLINDHQGGGHVKQRQFFYYFLPLGHFRMAILPLFIRLYFHYFGHFQHFRAAIVPLFSAVVGIFRWSYRLNLEKRDGANERPNQIPLEEGGSSGVGCGSPQ